MQVRSGGDSNLYTIDQIAEHDFSGDIILTAATKIEDSAFLRSAITSCEGDTVTEISAGAFRYCNELLRVSLPNCTKASSANYAFANSSSLKEIHLPKLSNWTNTQYLAYQSTALEVCDLGVVNSMTNNCFNGCTALRKLILRKTGSICTSNWATAAVFGGIYSNPTQSEIYVPSALISTYESASKWSDLKNLGVTFKAIEGSIYEL